MWDETKAPIISQLLIGVFDLYPVGSWVNNTGRVTLRYLDPIDMNYLETKYIEEINRRKEDYNVDLTFNSSDITKNYVSFKLRQLMLIGLSVDLNNNYIGDDISSTFKIVSILVNILIFFITLYFYLKIWIFLKNIFTLTYLSSFLLLIFLIFFITFFLYYYYLYIDVKKVKKD